MPSWLPVTNVSTDRSLGQTRCQLGIDRSRLCVYHLLARPTHDWLIGLIGLIGLMARGKPCSH